MVKITWRTMSSVFSLAPLTPRPPRPWVLNESACDRLHVLRLGHHDDELLVVDEVLDRHLTVVVGDLRTRGASANSSRIALSSSLITVRRRRSSARIAIKLGDALAHVGELGLEIDPRQAGQLAQLQVEDVDRPGPR